LSAQHQSQEEGRQISAKADELPSFYQSIAAMESIGLGSRPATLGRSITASA
jgi:hypothetical protein